MIKHLEKEESPSAEVAELGRCNTQLELRVERQAAQLEAERTELDNLTHSISHDLRSPIHIISGFAELLVKYSGQVLDEKGQHYLGRITTASIQLGRMMDEILALSRMGRSKMHFASVDLASVVNKRVHELENTKGARRINWQVGRLPTVEGDPNLLQEVITSLLSNALKFTLTREVARIQIGAQDSDSESILFVRDNGTNVNLKHRDRMFDETPSQHSTSDSKVGTIKLAYVQRIIHRHGGRTWTEAIPGDGFTFYFALPNNRSEANFS
jgi:light-regulated signal transduction histidine kinase (bacteriophytochrome)